MRWHMRKSSILGAEMETKTHQKKNPKKKTENLTIPPYTAPHGTFLFRREPRRGNARKRSTNIAQNRPRPFFFDFILPFPSTAKVNFRLGSKPVMEKKKKRIVEDSHVSSTLFPRPPPNPYSPTLPIALPKNPLLLPAIKAQREFPTFSSAHPSNPSPQKTPPPQREKKTKKHKKKKHEREKQAHSARKQPTHPPHAKKKRREKTPPTPPTGHSLQTQTAPSLYNK